MAFKLLPWIKDYVDNSRKVKIDDFIRFNDMVREFYRFLKPYYDSDVKIRPYRDLIDSDFKYKRFFAQDKIVNPTRYFQFCFGVVVIELVSFKPDVFCVRCFNFEFPDFQFKNGWYSDCLHTRIDTIDTFFKSGWYYYGSFPRSRFSVACEFFSFCVRAFIMRFTRDSDGDKIDDIRKYLIFSDNPINNVI